MPETAQPDLSEFAVFCGTSRARCGIALALEQLSPADAKKLQAALGTPTITGAGIARWLAARGQAVKQQTVTRHRAGECSCG